MPGGGYDGESSRRAIVRSGGIAALVCGRAHHRMQPSPHASQVMDGHPAAVFLWVPASGKRAL